MRSAFRPGDKVILFINGPFGVGKTSVSKLLDEKIPDAMVYDPEVIGAVLKRVSFKKVEDYQDYTLWRTLLVAGVRLLRKTSARTLVIPMTVWRRDLFDHIITGLRRIDEDLACFRLTASRGTLTDRIWSDAQDMAALPWRTSHVEICLSAFHDPAFGTEIRTDDRTPVEVADRILECLAMPAG